jgi:hypothetical protein
VVALAAIVLSSEVPIDPPSCCPVLTEAEATPASWGATPYVPAFSAVENMKPMPMPVIISGPRRSAA